MEMHKKSMDLHGNARGDSCIGMPMHGGIRGFAWKCMGYPVIRMGMHGACMYLLKNALGIHGFTWECTGQSWIYITMHVGIIESHRDAQRIHGFAWKCIADS